MYLQIYICKNNKTIKGHEFESREGHIHKLLEWREDRLKVMEAEYSYMKFLKIKLKIFKFARGWWCTPLTSALRRSRQADLTDFKASVAYRASSCIANTIQRNPLLKKIINCKLDLEHAK